MNYYDYYDSPLGKLTVVSNSEKITNLFLTIEQFDSFRSGKNISSIMRSDVMCYKMQSNNYMNTFMKVEKNLIYQWSLMEQTFKKGSGKN